MAFDLAALDAATPAEDGRIMTVFHAGTTEPVTDADGAPITVMLRGRYSPSAIKADRAIQVRRLDMARRGKGNEFSPEEVEAETTEMLVACTIAWSFDQLDGQPFPCLPANARKLWSDPRFRPIRDQASRFIADDSNFTTR